MVDCNPTQIDLILVKDPLLLTNFPQFKFGSFTSHDFIGASYSIDISKSSSSRNSVFSYRSLNLVYTSALFLRASELDWKCIYNYSDIDQMVEIITENCRILLDEFAPLKTKTVTRNVDDPPWMTDELRSLIDLRNFHHD